MRWEDDALTAAVPTHRLRCAAARYRETTVVDLGSWIRGGIMYLSLGHRVEGGKGGSAHQAEGLREVGAGV